MYKFRKCSIYMCLKRMCILYRRVVLYVCVCVHVWTCMCVCLCGHTNTYLHIPEIKFSDWVQIFYIHIGLVLHAFFKLLLEVVKISHYDCGLFSSSNVSLLCFLYFETMILGSHKIKNCYIFLVMLNLFLEYFQT